LKNVVILTLFENMVLPVAPLFDLGVDFHVFLCKKIGFLGQSSCFEVTVLIKSVTLFFEQCEILGQRLKGKIRKVAHPPPKFDATQ
jgi:hypothetical protein